MKKMAILVGLIFISLVVASQSNYKEAIQQGDDAQKRNDYSIAINKYFAAEAFTRDSIEIEFARQKVKEVFKKVDDLREKEKKAKITAVEANEKAEEAKKKAVEALNRATKLIENFYFYKDRFALAYASKGENKQKVFYFIDKNGDAIEKLKYWRKAEQFDEYTGYAKVIDNDEGITYLLDTLGNKYKYTNNINELDNTIQALDLSNANLSKLSDTIGNFINLKYLDLSGNRLDSLPKEIGKLTNFRPPIPS